MGHANVPDSALGAGEAGVCDVILHFRRRRGRTVRATRAAGAAILRASAAAITRAITTITGSAAPTVTGRSGRTFAAGASRRAGTCASAIVRRGLLIGASLRARAALRAGAPLLARAALRAGTVAPRAAGFALLGSRAMTERMALQERVTLRTLAVVQAAVAIDIEVDPQRRRR